MGLVNREAAGKVPNIVQNDVNCTLAGIVVQLVQKVFRCALEVLFAWPDASCDTVQPAVHLAVM